MDTHVGPVRGVLRHLAVGLAGQVEVVIRLDLHVGQVGKVSGVWSKTILSHFFLKIFGTLPLEAMHVIKGKNFRVYFIK